MVVYNEKENYEKRCNALLIAMLGSELAMKWWDSPNKAFDKNTPREIFEQDYMKVYSYLMRSAEGEW